MKQLLPAPVWVRWRTAAAGCALALSAALAASQPMPALSPVAATVPVFDSVMLPLLRVDWRNPLNPRFAPWGDDQFLFDTNQGVKLWDAVTNKSADSEFAAHLGASPMRAIVGKHSQAMLGNTPRGPDYVDQCSDRSGMPSFRYLPKENRWLTLAGLRHESKAINAQWRDGPRAHFAGGCAIKLANGRVFKRSLVGDFYERGLRAEIASAAFTRWSRLPRPPLMPPALLELMLVHGNRLVL
ncbi:MAG: hypothetical protein H7Z77_07225, partial [Chitinophagaceae bacterium]|nr:hypothetical protein [Polaromonas sp.]